MDFLRTLNLWHKLREKAVIPAQAGIQPAKPKLRSSEGWSHQKYRCVLFFWIPACAGMTLGGDARSLLKLRLLCRAAFSILSLALGVGLCLWLFRHVEVSAADWRAVWSSLSPMACVGVFALSALLMLSGARKWAILSTALHGEGGQEPKAGFFLRHTIWQNWIGQFVPPSLAIVLGRGWAARSMPALAVRSGLWNGLLDQALEFALLMAFIPGSILVLWGGGGVVDFLLGAALGVGLLALVAIIGRRWVPANLREVLWPVFGWSFVRAALTVLRLVAGVQALGLFLSALKVAAVAPLVSLLALVPLTPGNLGLAEWGWQGALVYAGEGAVAAALYAVAFRVLVLVVQTLLLGLNEVYVAAGKM